MSKIYFCIWTILIITVLSARADGSAYPRHMESIEPRVYYHGDRNSKQVALTIDDGWVEDPALIELLLETQVPAALFLPGRVIASRPEWVKQLHNLGFDICNHSFSHGDFTTMSENQIRNELRKTQELIISLTETSLPFFRPARGSYDERVKEIVADEGYIMVLWDNDVLGYWPDRPIETQLNYLRRNWQQGNIILSHFGSRLRTAEVLSIIIPEMRAKGYEFVSLTELLGYKDLSSKTEPGNEDPKIDPPNIPNSYQKNNHNSMPSSTPDNRPNHIRWLFYPLNLQVSIKPASIH